MDAFFRSLPKTAMAIGIIAVAFAVIILSDPPKTACDSQLELFKQGQGDFMYGSKAYARPLAKRLSADCKSANGPGGCFEFFVRLKKLNDDLQAIPRQCSETIAKDETLKAWLLASMKLMTQISWGDRGPASAMRRNAWFDASDLSLFCGLKKNSVQLYGIEEFEKWRDELLGALPEAETMDHETQLSKSLFATPCEAYRY